MVFDDDAKLIGLYQRYETESEEMKRQIVRYICSETGQDAQNALENDNADAFLEEVSSPDSQTLRVVIFSNRLWARR